LPFILMKCVYIKVLWYLLHRDNYTTQKIYKIPVYMRTKINSLKWYICIYIHIYNYQQLEPN
jgi:hypothetical protein